jgi:hypothetical protein
MATNYPTDDAGADCQQEKADFWTHQSGGNTARAQQ